MNWNDYLEAVTRDAKKAISESIDCYEDWQSMRDDLFIDRCIVLQDISDELEEYYDGLKEREQQKG